MEAFGLERVDTERDIHMQAWVNQASKQTKQTGKGKNAKSKPAFKSFHDFFDYEKAIESVKGSVKGKNSKKVAKRKHMAHIAQQVNKGA